MRLRTLGTVRLEGATTDLGGRRKDLALLAYLARRSPRAVSRAELADLLWEDRDEARSRQSLRQALLGLRRVVGEGLSAESDQVRLDRGALELDARLFETAIAGGRLADAVELWSGDFLEGMEEAGGESLRVWIEVERESLRRSLYLALERLSSAAAEQGDWDMAVDWASRWTDHLPYDERAHTRLVESLCLAGRASEAQVRHASFLARLRSELEGDPPATVQALGQRIARDLARPSSSHRPGSAALFTPDLVGRAGALAELNAGWAAARDGTPTMVVVTGETGIGKTRLVDEFARQVDTGGAAVVLRAAPGPGSVATFALADVILTQLASAPGLGGASPSTLAAIATLVPSLRERYPAIPAASATAESHTNTAGLAAEAMSAVAEERPVLLFVDDLERADPPTLATLAAIGRACRGRIQMVLAVGTDAGTGMPAELGAGMPVRRLKLPPLSPAEVEALVASMLVLPGPERHTLAARLHDEGGGNPLYTIELAAALVDEGALAVGDRGSWTLVNPEQWSLPMSGGIRTMMERRTAGLSTDARRVGEAVARLDPTADDLAVRSKAGLSAERFDAGRDELVARRLLRKAPPPRSGYQFHHQLVRRALLDEAARHAREAPVEAADGRMSWGRRLALTGVAVAVLGAVAVAAIRESNRPAPAAPPNPRQVLIVPPDLAPNASSSDTAAARTLAAGLGRALVTRMPPPSLIHGALARMRRRDTLSMGDRATGREIAERVGVRLLLTPTLIRGDGRLSAGYRIENTLTGAVLRAREREGADTAAAAALSAGLVREVERDVAESAHEVPAPDALPWVTTASIDALRAYASGSRLSNAGDGAGQKMLARAIAIDSTFGSAKSSLAYMAWFEYDQKSAERYALEALKSLGGLAPVESLKASIDAHNALENWPTAIECARALIELDPNNPVPWHTLGQLLYFDRRFAASVEAYDSALAQTVGPPPVTLLINYATVITRIPGRVADAVAEYEKAFVADPAVRRHPFINHEYGAALVRLGRVAEAQAAYADRMTGTPEERAGALRSMALLEAHLGRFARARELLDDAVTASGVDSDTLGSAIGHVLRADVALGAGDTLAAQSDLAALERWAAARPLPYEIVAHGVKLLARAGRPARAATLLRRLEAQTTAVSAAARARLLVARGEVLLAEGRTAEGRRALEEALALETTTEAKESAAYAARLGGASALAAQRYDSLAADRGVDWDGHVVIETGTYLAGRAWEDAGRPDRARVRYERFLTQWAGEVDSLLPAVVDARRRLSRP